MENAIQHPVGGVLVSGDLIFSTKITGTARALGLEVQVVGSPDAAIERIRSRTPRCVLLDLGLNSLTTESIGRIISVAAGATVLAFGSHVDTARLDVARNAGCTEVMPRSRLSGELPELLQRYLAVTPAE